jgi:hypothetical protein
LAWRICCVSKADTQGKRNLCGVGFSFWEGVQDFGGLTERRGEMRILAAGSIAVAAALLLAPSAFGADAVVEPKNLTWGDGIWDTSYYHGGGGAFTGDVGGDLWNAAKDTAVPRPTDTDSDVAYHRGDNNMADLTNYAPTASMVVDFGSTQSIDTLWLWNFLAGGNAAVGVNAVDIYMSDTGTRADDATFGGTADWSGAFAEATADGSVGGKSAIVREDKTSLGLSGRFLKFHITSNHGADGWSDGEGGFYPAYGFAELVFFAGGGPAYLAGDCDKNYNVNGVDLATLGLNWAPGGTTKVWADGNFDESPGDVDGVDLAALGLNWAPGGYGATPTPEPATVGLMALGLALVGLRRKVA